MLPDPRHTLAPQTGRRPGIPTDGILFNGPETMDTTGREIFVAYPWTLYSSRESYKKAYTSLQKGLAIKFLFAEERISSGHVLDKIEEMIQSTAFGIYDVSSWNPNVALEYGIARGIGAKAFIAFNPEKTELRDVPTDVRGYDRLQYTDFDELSDKVATLVTQELGRGPTPIDPLEADRRRLIRVIQEIRGRKLPSLPSCSASGSTMHNSCSGAAQQNSRLLGATRGMRYYPS